MSQSQKRGRRTQAKVRKLENRKLEIIKQMRDLKTDMAKINIELFKAGADFNSLLDW